VLDDGKVLQVTCVHPQEIKVYELDLGLLQSRNAGTLPVLQESSPSEGGQTIAESENLTEQEHPAGNEEPQISETVEEKTEEAIEHQNEERSAEDQEKNLEETKKDLSQQTKEQELEEATKEIQEQTQETNDEKISNQDLSLHSDRTEQESEEQKKPDLELKDQKIIMEREREDEEKNVAIPSSSESKEKDEDEEMLIDFLGSREGRSHQEAHELEDNQQPQGLIFFSFSFSLLF